MVGGFLSFLRQNFRIHCFQGGNKGLRLFRRNEYLIILVVAYGEVAQGQGGGTEDIVRGLDGGDGTHGDGLLEKEAVEHREVHSFHHVAGEAGKGKEINRENPLQKAGLPRPRTLGAESQSQKTEQPVPPAHSCVICVSIMHF